MILKYFKIKLFLNFERENVNFIVKLEEFKKPRKATCGLLI